MPQLHDFRRLISGLFDFAIIAILGRRNYDRAGLYLHYGLMWSVGVLKVAWFREIFNDFFCKSQIGKTKNEKENSSNALFKLPHSTLLI